MAEEQHDDPAAGPRKLVEIDVGSWCRPSKEPPTGRLWLAVALAVAASVAVAFLVEAAGRKQMPLWSAEAWRFLADSEFWLVSLFVLIVVRIFIAIVNWVIRRWHRIPLRDGPGDPSFHETVVPNFGRSPSEIWSRVQSLKQSPLDLRPRLQRVRQILLGTIAVVFALAASIFVLTLVQPLLYKPPPHIERIVSILFNVSLVLVVVCPLLATLVRRLTMPSGRSLREQDPRKPILFLRSFVDDDLTVLRTVRVFDRLQTVKLRFEDAIADELSRYGPFLAIGRPDEWLPRTGAAREYVGEGEWRDRVSGLADEALVIVVSLGRSEGMEWELRHLIARRQIGKVIILVPPRGHRPMQYVIETAPDAPLGAGQGAIRGVSGDEVFAWRDRKERWRKLSFHFDGTEWAEALQEADATRALAALFLPGGRVAVLRSDQAEERDYRLAIVGAIYQMYFGTLAGSEQAQPAV
jgi:hypothetical protein